MQEDFVINPDGWAEGRMTLRYRAGKAFFERYGHPDILDADVDVTVEVEKCGSALDVDCRIEGTVTVPCDRCIEDLVLRVEASPAFTVPAPGETAGAPEREPLELVDGVLDLRQAVYDYTCLALPLQRVHPQDGCDPEVLKHLRTEEADPVAESPFAALKDMMGKKRE